MSDPSLIIGLGNPGRQYETTRHNIGFVVVERLARHLGAGPWQERFLGRFTRAGHGDQALLLLLPQTFMNLSGKSAARAASFFHLPRERGLVVHDELDLPFGQLRAKVGGGTGGHKGLVSLVAELGGGEFSRLRCGIGRPARGDPADYVLAGFTPMEQAELPDLVERAMTALLEIVERGLPAAMNTVNRKHAPQTD